jgi:hypothetical protein
MEDTEQRTSEPEAADQVLRERPRAPIGQLGYGFWLNPYINDTNMESSKSASGAATAQQMQDPQNSASASAPTSTEPSPVPEPRRRGRPRVSTARNESAIEVGSGISRVPQPTEGVLETSSSSAQCSTNVSKA